MKKIFLMLCLVALSVAVAIFWHRTHSYAVGIFLPVERGAQTPNLSVFRGLLQAWQLGIADAGATQKIETTFVQIPPDIDESIPVIKKEVAAFLARHNRWWWDDGRMMIIAGFMSSQLNAAAQEVREHGRNVLCANAGSTSPAAQGWGNVLQAVHNDAFAAQAVGIFLRRKQYDKVAVLYLPGEPYSQSYMERLVPVLDEQKIAFKTYAFSKESIQEIVQKDVNQFLADAKKAALVFIGFIPEVIRAEKVLDPRVELVCSEMCSGLGDVFAPARTATVAIPATVDYTATSKSVWERLFALMNAQVSNFNYRLAYGVPFMYDLAYQIGGMVRHGFDFTWPYLENQIDAARPSAALSSTWYIQKNKGPAHGGYWFIYTHDAKKMDMVALNKKLLGALFTLPQSAGVAYQIGNFAWAGLSGWNVYQNIWEDYYLGGDLVATKPSCVSYSTNGGLFNWAPIHVKRYRDIEGKWWFAGDIEDHYPLQVRAYNLR